MSYSSAVRIFSMIGPVKINQPLIICQPVDDNFLPKIRKCTIPVISDGSSLFNSRTKVTHSPTHKTGLH